MSASDRVHPSDVLALKYARGEITEEELEKKIAHLRKLGLVKWREIGDLGTQ